MIYKVQPGDTLAEIANRFGVPLATLIELNDIQNINEIFIGQELFIPDGEEPVEREPEPRPVRKPETAQFAIRRINNLLLIAFASKSNYRKGETVILYLIKINIGNSPVSFHYSTAQRFDFTAETNNLEWTWSRERSFAFQQADVVIEPEECEVYSARWDQKSNDNRQMTGNIEITGWNIAERIDQARLTFSINIG